MVRSWIRVSAAIAACHAQNSQIGMVIGLIQDEIQKVTREAAQEETDFVKSSRDKGRYIKAQAEEIAETQQAADDATEAIAGAKAEMEAMDEKMKDEKAAQAELEKQRLRSEKLRGDFKTMNSNSQTDLDNTISAVKLAIEAIGKAKADQTGKSKDNPGLMQLVESALNLGGYDASGRDVAVLLQNRSSFLKRKPEAAKIPTLRNKDGAAVGLGDKELAYDWKSRGVLELLEGLLEKFIREKNEALQADTNSLNAVELEKQAREEADKASKAEWTAANKAYGDAKLEKIKNEGLLKAANKANKDAKDQKQTAENNLKQSQAQWEVRSATRTEELEAMKDAIHTLKKANGVRESDANKDFVGFLQLDDPLAVAAQNLKKVAMVSHKAEFSRLADMISEMKPDEVEDNTYKGWNTAAAKGPFDTIKQTIQKMKKSLMEEQIAEDKQHAYCRKETETTINALYNKDLKHEDLANKVSALVATVDNLNTQVGKAQDDYNTALTSLADAKEDREAEYKDNQICIADAQKAQKALAGALVILREFYAKAATTPEMKTMSGTSTTNTDTKYSGDSNPFGATYRAESGSKTDILTKLGTVQSDFAKAENTCAAMEEQQNKQFQDAKTGFTVQMSRKKAEEEAKAARSGKLNEERKEKATHKKATEDEILNTKIYWDDLWQSCIGKERQAPKVACKPDASPHACNKQKKEETVKAMSQFHSERKAARTAEIKALGEAQDTLRKAFQKAVKPEKPKGF